VRSVCGSDHIKTTPSADPVIRQLRVSECCDLVLDMWRRTIVMRNNRFLLQQLGHLPNLQHVETDNSARGGFFTELPPKKKNVVIVVRDFVKWNSSIQNAFSGLVAILLPRQQLRS
jgi:hypothetical protein